MSTFRFSSLVALSISIVACSGNSPAADEDSTGALIGDSNAEAGAPSVDPNAAADQALAKLIADAPKRLSKANADAITAAAIAPTPTLKRLKMANDFAKQRIAAAGDGDTAAYDRIVLAVSTFYAGTPRDLSAPTAGQTFATSGKPRSSDGAPPTMKLTVAGVASDAYKLSFRIANKSCAIAVPKGATAADTAKLIGAEVEKNQSAIDEAFSSDFPELGGGASPPIDGSEVKVKGDTVSQELWLNG